MLDNREIAQEIFIRMMSQRPDVWYSSISPYSYEQVQSIANYAIDCGLAFRGKIADLDAMHRQNITECASDTRTIEEMKKRWETL